MAEIKERLIRHPDIHAGALTVRGTRIPVKNVLEFLAQGDDVNEIIVQYPQLTPDDIRAIIAYAAICALHA